ncbi:MAG TPA: hypothetical protein EYN67_06855 [Flavobacteriales bacterium]|nr:hypothetical protein [Flavobacteriales bacterium]
MGFSGGGSNITKPHTHDSTIVQDGGSLAPNVTQFGLTAGSILYSDGSNIQELGVGSASDTLTVNGAATAPEWAAAGGSVYELVGTTTALVTAPNGYNGIHLAFSAIDMTTVTELVAVVAAERGTNSLGFLWNGQTSGYGYGGHVTNYAGSGTDFGNASGSLFEIGHWASGTYQNFTVHFVLNQNDNKTYCYGVGGGSGGSAYAGGGNSNVDTEIDSISFVESGMNMPAGDHRLTVYKVSR